MDASLTRRELIQRRTVYDGSCEIGLETALVLPDYLGDIERILRCSLVPRASSKRIEGQRLSVGGMAFMRMIYITAEGKVESFETQIPFSKNIDLPSSGENPTATVKFETEYSNCLAVSPRRVELRGALLMRVRVQSSVALSIVKDIENSGVEVKKKKFDAAVPICSCQENFTVMEEYELDYPISSVVRMNAAAKVLESKVVSGKLIIKGEIELLIIYICDESGQIKNAKFTIPVQHFINADKAEEGDNVRVCLEICSMSAEPITSRMDNQIEVEVLLEAAAEITRNEQIEAVVDCYCIGHESAAEKTDVSVCSLSCDEEKNHQHCIPFDNDVSGEVIDAFADVKNINCNVNEHGEIMMKADLTGGLLLKTEDGAEIFEKTVPLEISVAADDRYIGAYCDGGLYVLSVSKTPNKNEVCVLLSAKAHIMRDDSVSVINQMAISSETSSPRDSKIALTIYFASEGEDAFDIAKRYNTSARAVMQQNGLDDTYINKPQKILIPMVK